MTANRKALLFWSFMIGSAISPHAAAYELATHARITQAVFGRSILSDTKFVKELGIDSTAVSPFGDIYYDVSSGDVRERKVDPFEARFMPVKAEETLTLPAWLMRGAIREDDYTGRDAPNPQDDPYNAGNWLSNDRPLNHFYDPWYDRALTVAGIAWGKKAPNWGLGAADAFHQPNDPEVNRRNHFTLYDAREAMYRALTGRDQEHQEIAKTEEERNKYWATTFRALGDVAHLVQDMAQPQHTRNDPHAGKRFDRYSPLGHKSVYEAYVEARATGTAFSTAGFASLPSPLSLTRPPLSYGDYPPPRFNNYLSYFTTRRGNDGNVNGLLMAQGLSDYSHRGFFSAGTNLGDTRYPLPSPAPESYGRQVLDEDWQGQPLGGKVELLTGGVPDSLDAGQSAADVPLTTLGLWDQFLEEKGWRRSYTLNRYNYDAMADLLIPRAVAYSAGLINHFFRARISARYVNHSPLGTAGQAAMRVRNTGQSTLNGTFEVYYDKEDESRVLLATKEGSLPPISEGQEPVELVVEFQAPVITTSATQPYTVVFKGHDEQATDEVVTGAKAASAVLAFNGKDGFKTIDPKGVAVTPEGERVKLIRPYEGSFVAGSRTRPHPSSSAYALIFHPFSGQVGIADYAANKAVDIAGPGSGRNTLTAANWLGETQFVVASFSTQATLNSWPFYPKATVTYRIYDWDPASSAFSLASQKVVPISLAPIYPSAAMGLFWGEPPWPRDGNWWSFDVNRKGEMVTAMYSATTESEPPVESYVHPSNCANPVRVQVGEVSTTTYRYFILTIRPDGSYKLGEPVATSTDKTTAWRYYDTPNPPSYIYYCEGRLNKQTVDRAIRGVRLAHVDVTPKGALGLAVYEESSDWGIVANLPSTTSWNNETDYAVTRSWKANGVSLATSTSTASGSESYDNGIRTSEYDESHREIEIYDLQYDGIGTPWALWVHNHWQASSAGGGTLKNDTAFYVGNGAGNSLLFQATSPSGYSSLMFGPPIFPADIVVNPYGDGVVAVAHIIGQQFNDEPDYWYTPQLRDHFVNYIDGDGTRVDLYTVHPETFDWVQDFQFLP